MVWMNSKRQRGLRGDGDCEDGERVRWTDGRTDGRIIRQYLVVLRCLDAVIGPSTSKLSEFLLRSVVTTHDVDYNDDKHHCSHHPTQHKGEHKELGLILVIDVDLCLQQHKVHHTVAVAVAETVAVAGTVAVA